MVDNHPAPSGLKNLLIEAGLISCGRNSLPVFKALTDPYCQGQRQASLWRCSPPHPKTGLAEIVSTIFLLFSSIPGTFCLCFVTGLAGERGGGKRIGKKSFISISRAVFQLPKSRRAELMLTEPPLTGQHRGETCASISSPVPRGQSEPSRGVHRDQRGERKQFDQGALESGTWRNWSGGVFQL